MYDEFDTSALFNPFVINYNKDDGDDEESVVIEHENDSDNSSSVMDE